MSDPATALHEPDPLCLHEIGCIHCRSLKSADWTLVRKADADVRAALAAALPKVINFRFLPPRVVTDPMWDVIAGEVLTAEPRLTLAAPVDAERLAQAWHALRNGGRKERPCPTCRTEMAALVAALAGHRESGGTRTMTPLAAIHDGKPVAVIAIPTISTAIVVESNNRPRAVRLLGLEVLPGCYGSIGSSITYAQSVIAIRRRSRKLGRTA